MTEWGWWGFNLPNRECKGTYQLFPYESLPDVNIKPKYNYITDIIKLGDFLDDESNSDDPLLNSPTACYFDTNHTSIPTIFYVDQQGCIIWCLNQDGTVVTTNGVTVAKSLPEFLTRISIENSIWFKSFDDKSFSAEEMKYLIDMDQKARKPT